MTYEQLKALKPSALSAGVGLIGAPLSRWSRSCARISTAVANGVRSGNWALKTNCYW